MATVPTGAHWYPPILTGTHRYPPVPTGTYHSTILHMIFLLTTRREISWSFWLRVKDWKKILSYGVCWHNIFFQSSTHDQIILIFETEKVFLFNLMYFLWLLTQRNGCCADDIFTNIFYHYRIWFLFWNMMDTISHTIPSVGDWHGCFVYNNNWSERNSSSLELVRIKQP